MKKVLFLVVILFISVNITAQVGVGTTTPAGALDVNSTTQGMIPPRVALTATNVAAPVVNPQGGALVPGTLVWNTNTAGVIPTNVAPGMYYWDGTRWVSLAGSPGGLDWSIIGNGGIDGGVTGLSAPPTVATQGTHFIGTYDATNFDIRTAGLHAARVSSLGEFFIGGLETVLPGDLMNGISEGNVAFPWAVNGYTDQDGAGTYGRVSGGTTNFGAIQGEYAGTGTNATGVRGIYETTNAGTALNTHIAGVKGSLFFNGGAFSAQNFGFGVSGTSLANSGRTVGGVYGTNTNNGTYGMLGYERSNGANAAVLGNAAYTNNTFRISNNINTSVGLAINGGFLGGHLKGTQYGLITKGDLVGQYTDGSNISTKGYAVITKNNSGNKTTSYVPTSTSVDVSSKGTGKLSNGETFIAFDNNYANLIDNSKPIIVTVSPMGESNGVYVSQVTEKGFYVKENANGNSNVNFYWIAIGERINANELAIPNEILASDFDQNLDSYLTIDENASEENISKAMWWNGSSLEFGRIAPKEAHEGTAELKSNERPKGEKKPKKANLRASQINEIVKEGKK